MSADPATAPPLPPALDRALPRYTSYPTAPHFHAGIDGGVAAGWLAALPADASLSLYLHVPFCRQLCHFCGCLTRAVRRPEPVEAYAALLLREVDLVAAAIGGRRRVVHLHWGGGTPTILPPDTFLRLVEAIARRFDLAPGAEHAIEIDPRVLDAPRIAALAAAGVTRASLGVQDMDPVVQRAIGRVQPFETTARAVEGLRAAGIDAINVDLVYGLPHQTEAGIVAGLDRLLPLGPDRLALFGYAHVPWMKTHQRLIPAEALPDAAARARQFAAAAARIAAGGWRAIGIDHFARPGDALSRAADAGRLRRNFQGYTADPADALVGLGASSIGALPEGYLQNAPDTGGYGRAIEAGRLATVRGIALAPDDRLRAAIIERIMCDLAVDVAAVAAAHGASPAPFAPALARLAADGVEVEGWRVRVPPDLPQLARVAAAAFDAYLAPHPARHAKVA